MPPENKRTDREDLLIRMDERWKFVKDGIESINDHQEKQWEAINKNKTDIAVSKKVYGIISALWFALLAAIGWQLK